MEVGVGVGVVVFVGVAVGETVRVSEGCIGEEVVVYFVMGWVMEDGDSDIGLDPGRRNISDALHAERKNSMDKEHRNRGRIILYFCIEIDLSPEMKQIRL